jgi:hypothetical protein
MRGVQPKLALKHMVVPYGPFQLLLLQILRAPHFNIGHIGSMGRGKCHAEMSADARFVAAGAADGQVRQHTII